MEISPELPRAVALTKYDGHALPVPGHKGEEQGMALKNARLSWLSSFYGVPALKHP